MLMVLVSNTITLNIPVTSMHVKFFLVQIYMGFFFANFGG